MSRYLLLSFWALAGLALATPALADPPGHAPAHGYRAKHHKHRDHDHHRHRDDHHHRDDHYHGHPGPAAPSPGGFQVVFDPDRGISIAVGFPGVYFHDDLFYRMHAGIWQTSARADGGWQSIAPRKLPSPIREAFPRPEPKRAKSPPRGWRR